MQKKKRLQAFLFFFIFAAVAMVVECDVYFPDHVHLFYGETFAPRQGSPYTVEAAGTADIQVTGEYNAEIKLFGVIPVKNVAVSVLPEQAIVPCGKTVGIKLFTKGLMCVGTEVLTGEDGRQIDAAKEIGLLKADMILAVNGVQLTTVEQFEKLVLESAGNPMTLRIKRGEAEFEKTLTPVHTQEGFRLGIWVRDSTAGIGTVTFVEQNTGVYGALGHPITDVDTGAPMPIEHGSVTDAKIVTVKKGERGSPGELGGLFSQSDTDRGVIFKNTDQGIYGVMEQPFSNGISDTPVPIASKSAIHTGKAQIYATVEENKTEAFDVEIIKLMKYAKDDKNMVVEITDPRLLEKTGGIVQGM